MNTFVETDGVRNMEGDDEEDEEDGKRVLGMITLHSAPSPFPQKMNFPELYHYFSAVTWSGRSNLIACATETCARDPGTNQQPAFWIPVHIFDPERPTEHAIFNVTADLPKQFTVYPVNTWGGLSYVGRPKNMWGRRLYSPNDSLQFLEWSPVSCAQALLVCNSGGRVTIWSQPTHGAPNVARTVNCWACEHEWRQEQAIAVKWVSSLSPYRFSPTPSVGAPSSKSLEERFLGHVPRSSVRWPNFLCICSISYSGSVQLHWRQWPSAQTGSSLKWFSTNKAVLGAGPSGLFAADVTVTDTASLIVAGTPVGTPSTVIVWEISPWVMNSSGGNQQPLKYGLPLVGGPMAFGPPPWPGMAALAAYLLSWQEQPGLDTKSGQSHVDNDEKAAGPLLHCSPISNLSAYVTPDASTLTTWGSGVADIAFDPSRGGSALVTLICEGYFICPEFPDDGPSLTGWRFQRWESSSQPVAIHPLFETGNGTYPASTNAMVTSWTAVSSNVISPRGLSSKGVPGNLVQIDVIGRRRPSHLHRPENPRSVAHITFSGHGGEFAIALITGEVYVFSGSCATPIESFVVRPGPSVTPAVAFSPTSCCLASVWHSKKTDCSLLKFLCLEPSSSVATPGSIGGPLVWERYLADRFWWSLVNELDWWDIIACTQLAVEDGAVTVARVTALLDADFHALPKAAHRQCYSTALDRIKCRVLEGTDAADIRALVLDMQARLLLDMLGKGIEAALVNPATLVAEPWMASSESLSNLGPDAMAVDTALVPAIQAYVDSILDLASHFLTRLRRYASFCRTLASHAVGNPSAINNIRSGVNFSSGGSLATQAGQGAVPQSSSGNNTGTAGVQAWVQGAIAIAKINSSAESATSNSSTVAVAPSAPLPFVNTGTFPGIPAVRLIGDCQFVHKLCQLLFFCLLFRKRQRYVPGPRMPADSTGGTKSVGGVAPKTEDMSATSAVSRSISGASNVKMEDGTRGATAPVTKSEEVQNTRSARVGSGNAGQGYTSDEVKYLFLVLCDLCKKTSFHAHPMPKSQVGMSNPAIRLHYVDGQYNVTPDVVDSSLGPHMQQLPRPRGADAAGLLMRELELHPPAEEWNRKSISFGPWGTHFQRELESLREEEHTAFEMWPRKRRYAERDAALGLRTAIGLGSFSGFMGSRRDVITGVWKTAQHGVWHKCLRCGRQTASLAAPTLPSAGAITSTSSRETWWTGRWAHGCPMCGGRWTRIL